MYLRPEYQYTWAKTDSHVGRNREFKNTSWTVSEIGFNHPHNVSIQDMCLAHNRSSKFVE